MLYNNPTYSNFLKINIDIWNLDDMDSENDTDGENDDNYVRDSNNTLRRAEQTKGLDFMSTFFIKSCLLFFFYNI